MKKTVKVSQTERMEVHAARPLLSRDSPFDVTVATHSLETPDNRARFAMECVARWGMVAAVSDGEDSAGRSRLRAASAKEVAEKAVDCTSELFNKFQELGWVIPVPAMEDLEDLIQQAEDSN